MPLEPTPRRDQPWTRTSRLLLLALLAAALLAGCAEGTATDAERGRARDAERESVLSDLQATETWRIINAPGTPSPAPNQE